VINGGGAVTHDVKGSGPKDVDGWVCGTGCRFVAGLNF
jgi:hypothetical protein